MNEFQKYFYQDNKKEDFRNHYFLADLALFYYLDIYLNIQHQILLLEVYLILMEIYTLLLLQLELLFTRQFPY